MYHRRVAASCHDGSIQFRGNLSRRNAEVSRSHQAMIVDTMSTSSRISWMRDVAVGHGWGFPWDWGEQRHRFAVVSESRLSCRCALSELQRVTTASSYSETFL